MRMATCSLIKGYKYNQSTRVSCIAWTTFVCRSLAVKLGSEITCEGCLSSAHQELADKLPGEEQATGWAELLTHTVINQNTRLECVSGRALQFRLRSPKMLYLKFLVKGSSYY